MYVLVFQSAWGLWFHHEDLPDLWLHDIHQNQVSGRRFRQKNLKWYTQYHNVPQTSQSDNSRIEANAHNVRKGVWGCWDVPSIELGSPVNSINPISFFRTSDFSYRTRTHVANLQTLQALFIIIQLPTGCGCVGPTMILFSRSATMPHGLGEYSMRCQLTEAR